MKNYSAVGISNSLITEIDTVISSKKNPYFAIQIPVASTQIIESNPLYCFYPHYQKLGGSALPKDVVNMIIQQINRPQTVTSKASTKLEIFGSAIEQILAKGITSHKEAWRLACIYTQIEFEYKISFFNWQYHYWLNKFSQ